VKVLKESVSGIVVLTLKGEFDSFVTTAFGGEITKVQEEGCSSIVLNMNQVRFINSTALGAMIKARKACRAAHGDLVVSQPSTAVIDAMESLGLDRLFTIYDDDELALSALEGGGGIDLEGESESAVMIHIPETTRPQVGRLTRLDVDSLECRLNADPGKLVPGRQVRLKFRLPLYRKEFFDLAARIERMERTPAGSVLSMQLTKVEADDRAAIESFVADMSELRRAAREGE
jgi:anti-anti-sigma factor